MKLANEPSLDAGDGSCDRWFVVSKVLFLLFCFTVSFASASSQSRVDSIRNARVWSHPAWMAADFQFDSNFDIVGGPEKTGWEKLLEANPAQCRFRDSDAKEKFSGVTMKFYCGFGDHLSVAKDDDLKKVKIKYKFDDGEIPSELLATRLFWALGFGADRMYPVARLECFGCTKDPFPDRRVDPASEKSPQVFERVAAERKLAGKSIGSGWKFEELMTLTSNDPAAKREQLVQRDALRLLSVFVQHADNKPENQRLLCEGTATQGGCSGETVAYVNDLGATFGGGARSFSDFSKAWYPDWNKKAIWSDPKNCIANLGLNSEGEMENPQISDGARIFLAKLLKAFSDGPLGRERVRALFKTGWADNRGGTIDEWTATFLRKVDEIAQPEGPPHPGFKCPLPEPAS